MIKAINDNDCILPRYIVFDLDNEIVTSIKYKGFSFSGIMRRAYSWLINKVDKAIRETKDLLPTKSKKKFEPQVIWVATPEHKALIDNFKRDRANEILSELLEKQQDMKMIRPIKGWDNSDE